MTLQPGVLRASDIPRNASPLQDFDLAQVNVRLVRNWDDAQDFMRWLGEGRNFLGLDIETTGLNVGSCYTRLVQFGDLRMGWAVPFEMWKGLIKQAIESYDGKIVLHNALFDIKFLKAAGITVPQRLVHDTMIMAHLINPSRSVALKTLAVKEVDRRAGFGQGELSAAFKGGSWWWDTVPWDHPAYWLYSAMDTVITAALAEKLWPQMGPHMEAYEIEMGCIHVLRDAELAGLQLDGEYTAAAAQKLVDELNVLAPQLPCNPNSEKGIVDFLIGRGCTLTVKTEKGNWSVDDKVLGYWGQFVPEVELLRRARKATKLLSAYFSNFSTMGVPQHDLIHNVEFDGKGSVNGVLAFPHRFDLHCNVRPVGAKTGRMSVTDPALQTLPRGCVVRDAFIPRDGHQLLISDYSQMELRVMAHYANEEAMIAAFTRGEDLHNFVARAAYGDDFTKQQRSIAKNAGFAKIYGAGVDKFAMTCKITVPEAEAFLARYDESFPGVTRWQIATIEGVRRGAVNKIGSVTTRYGRRIPVPIGEAFKACNYLIQGSCAQVMKMKLIEMSNAGLHDFIRLPVHDEVICEVPDEFVEEARHIMDKTMPDTHSFSVPLDAEAEVFDRWGEKYVQDGYERFLPEYFEAKAASDVEQ